MSKYIDAEKLKAEIERRIESWATREKYALPGQGKDTCQSRVTELTDLLLFIDSLQQEQKDILVLNKKDWEEQEQFRKDKKFGTPLQKEQPEVDLEKD